jgi:hypothetical protein
LLVSRLSIYRSGTVNVFFPSLAGITDDHLDFERTKMGRDRSEHPAMRNSRRHRSKGTLN